MEHLYLSLEQSPRILNELLEEIPQQRYTDTFSDKYWSIINHLEHLVETQQVFLERIQLFRDEDSPRIKAFVPDDERAAAEGKEETAAELLMDFSALREQQLKILRELPESVYEKKAQHDEHVTTLSFKRMVMHFLSHDHYHIYRIEELGSFKEDFISPL